MIDNSAKDFIESIISRNWLEIIKIVLILDLPRYALILVRQFEISFWIAIIINTSLYQFSITKLDSSRAAGCSDLIIHCLQYIWVDSGDKIRSRVVCIVIYSRVIGQGASVAFIIRVIIARAWNILRRNNFILRSTSLLDILTTKCCSTHFWLNRFENFITVSF